MDSSSTALLGFRNWKIDNTNNVLRSCAVNKEWSPGLNLGSCHKEHAAPDTDCDCGFNGYYKFKDADKSGYNGIIGAFAGAGKMELHSVGFRSAEAQIIALYSKTTSSSKQAIAKRYDVPLFSKKKAFLDYVGSRPGISEYSDVEFSKKSYDTINKMHPIRFWETRKARRIECIGYVLAFLAVIAWIAKAQYQLVISTDTSLSGDIAISASMVIGILIAIYGTYKAVCSSYIRRGHKTSLAGDGIGFACIFAVSFLIVLTVMSITNSFETADKITGITQAREGLISTAVLQEKYYQLHNRFTDDISDLNKNTSALSDSTGKLPKIKITNNGQQYLLLGTEASDESSIKGYPGKIEPVCFGEQSCSDNFWNIDQNDVNSVTNDLKPDPHNTGELVRDFENIESKTLANSDCLAGNLVEKSGIYDLNLDCSTN